MPTMSINMSIINHIQEQQSRDNSNIIRDVNDDIILNDTDLRTAMLRVYHFNDLDRNMMEEMIIEMQDWTCSDSDFNSNESSTIVSLTCLVNSVIDFFGNLDREPLFRDSVLKFRSLFSVARYSNEVQQVKYFFSILILELNVEQFFAILNKFKREGRDYYPVLQDNFYLTLLKVEQFLLQHNATDIDIRVYEPFTDKNSVLQPTMPFLERNNKNDETLQHVDDLTIDAVFRNILFQKLFFDFSFSTACNLTEEQLLALHVLVKKIPDNVTNQDYLSQLVADLCCLPLHADTLQNMVAYILDSSAYQSTPIIRLFTSFLKEKLS